MLFLLRRFARRKGSSLDAPRKALPAVGFQELERSVQKCAERAYDLCHRRALHEVEHYATPSCISLSKHRHVRCKPRSLGKIARKDPSFTRLLTALLARAHTSSI